MNKSESKYFNTAIKMDKAFLELLSEKDFEYITIKDICKKAGVNRSTFYLHYETMFVYVFSPILMRFNIPENEHHYTITFYINGIIALIMEWLKNDCKESIEDIADIIIRNIKSSES